MPEHHVQVTGIASESLLDAESNHLSVFSTCRHSVHLLRP